jgi:hypothetical protein
MHPSSAVVGDDNHAALYIDGEITYVSAFNDFRVRYDENQDAFIADSFHSAVELSEVRYFTDRLTQPEIKTMYEDWLAAREGEGCSLCKPVLFCGELNLKRSTPSNSSVRRRKSFSHRGLRRRQRGEQ